MTRLVIGLLALTPSILNAQEVGRDSSWVDRGVHVSVRWEPEMRLEWELVVPAPIDAVWEAWTVEEEMVKWTAPGAAIDLRVGGYWEAHFNPDRPPGQRGSEANEILWIEPGRELWIAAGAPIRFPEVRREKTLFRLTLEPVGAFHTRVIGAQTGWQDGQQWLEAFRYLATANSEWLNWLHRRFTEGPIDWEAMMPGG